MIRAYNVLAILISVAVCVVIVVAIAGYVLVKGKELFTTTSPLVYALLVGVCLVVLVIINAVQEFRPKKQTTANSGAISTELPVELRLVGLYAAGLLLYVWLLRYLHFAVGSCIFVALGMFALNRTSAAIGKKALLAAAATLIRSAHPLRGVQNHFPCHVAVRNRR